jgi:hypothetical protein
VLEAPALEAAVVEAAVLEAAVVEPGPAAWPRNIPVSCGQIVVMRSVPL